VRKGKDIRATEIGKKLITSLPVQISQPDMTALWESQLESISNKTLNYQFFIKGVEKNLQQLILEVKDIAFTDLPQSNTPRRFTKKRNRKRAT
jgi:DNA topoisomerase-3